MSVQTLRGTHSRPDRRRPPLRSVPTMDEALREYPSAVAVRKSQLREWIVEGHMELVRGSVRRLAPKGTEAQDLSQVAVIGLLSALDRFDPSVGSFEPFAYACVRGELKRYFRDKTWALRVPRQIQELSLEVRILEGELCQKLGRSPTVKEIADLAQRDEHDVIEALTAGFSYKAVSLDLPVWRSDDRPEAISATLGDEDPDIDRVEKLTALAPGLAKLSADEQELLQLRFVDGMTQSAIAEILGVSQMQVSRRLLRTLGRLRDHISPPDPASGGMATSIAGSS